MPSINMIAPRRAQKKRLESNVQRLVIVILAEVLLMLCIAGFLLMRIYGTRSMVGDLDVQLAKLEPTVHRIEYYDKATQGLKPKVDTLNQAKSQTLRWCRVLDDLSLSLPAKTWLTRISTTPPQAGATEIIVNLNGVSASQELVGQAMLRMHDTVSDFRRLDLHFTQNAIVGFQTAVEFEVAAAIEIPKEAPKEVEKS